MKKLSLLFVLCIMILALVGCGGGGGSQYTTIPANGGDEQNEPIDDKDNPERPNVVAMLHTLADGIKRNDINKTMSCFESAIMFKFYFDDDAMYKDGNEISAYFSDLFTNMPFRSYQFMNYSMTFSGSNVVIDADVYFTEFTSSNKTVYSVNEYSVEIKATKYAPGWKISSYVCTAPVY